MLWLNNVSGKFQLDTTVASHRPVLPRNAQCCCLQRRNVITHMLPCHAQHDTARGTSKKCVLQVQCDVFLQWLSKDSETGSFGGLHGWRAWKAYLSSIQRFPDSGMYVVRSGFDVWISVAVWRVQRPVSSPSSARLARGRAVARDIHGRGLRGRTWPVHDG